MKEFIIDHIDPFGQGVYKKEKEIFFIPKTLPGETGTFKVLKKKKGVHFCSLGSLEKESEIRQAAQCLHYDRCNGCHFLHTDYSSELGFKKKSYLKLLKELGHNNLELKIIDAPKRLEYRNRIQLHYNLRQKTIGLKRAQSSEIIPIPNCQIIRQELRDKFKWLYHNWEKEIKRLQLPFTGHAELYFHKGNVHITWNKPYAALGFTQVNQATNDKMTNILLESYSSISTHILDLFGGEGNLTHKFQQQKCLSVDLYSDNRNNSRYHHLDLFQESALKDFIDQKSNNFDTLFIDPPRSGFKQLAQWVKCLNPQHLAYISCHPATMIRDLKLIPKSYSISQIYLVDLFPSTFHYEAMIFFKNRS